MATTYPIDILNPEGTEVVSSGQLNFTDASNAPATAAGGIATPTAVAPTGLTGSVVASRYVGGTASVAPTTGLHAVGDFVITATGRIWVCTVAGTPGTWVEPASVTFAPLASPTLTGTPAAPTAAADTATTQLATTAYVVNQAYAKLAGPTFTGTVVVPAAAATTSAPRINQLTSALTITSGTLPNMGTWVSGTAKVNPVTRQITVFVECVFDGTANAATVGIGVSADDSTYTTVGTPGVSSGLNTVGAHTVLVPVTLPAGWFVKLTIAAHASVAASIYF
jgi:hypothetical protein